MGQKININALKINNSLSWVSTWSSNNINFSDIFLKDFELQQNIKYILNFNNIFSNKIFFRRFFKKNQLILNCLSQINVMVINYSSISFKYFIINIRKKNIKFLPITTNLFFFNFLKLQKNQNQEKFIVNASFFNKKTVVFLPFINSSVISNYIVKQLKISVKFKDKIFKQNLQKGIKFLLSNYYKKYKITGIKVVCSGKWKKTKSGRKQKFTISFGKINKQQIFVPSDYFASSTTTKFGICNISVWISYKYKNICF